MTHKRHSDHENSLLTPFRYRPQKMEKIHKTMADWPDVIQETMLNAYDTYNALTYKIVILWLLIKNVFGSLTFGFNWHLRWTGDPVWEPTIHFTNNLC